MTIYNLQYFIATLFNGGHYILEFAMKQVVVVVAVTLRRRESNALGPFTSSVGRIAGVSLAPKLAEIFVPARQPGRRDAAPVLKFQAGLRAIFCPAFERRRRLHAHYPCAPPPMPAMPVLTFTLTVPSSRGIS